jgi:hypothetical protein
MIMYRGNPSHHAAVHYPSLGAAPLVPVAAAAVVPRSILCLGRHPRAPYRATKE